MFIVGHVVVALVLMVEDFFAPALWVHALLWTPLVLGMSLWLLPRIKGALIGLQWANRMHGFGGEDEDVFELDPEAVDPAAGSAVGFAGQLTAIKGVEVGLGFGYRYKDNLVVDHRLGSANGFSLTEIMQGRKQIELRTWTTPPTTA